MNTRILLLAALIPLTLAGCSVAVAAPGATTDPLPEPTRTSAPPTTSDDVFFAAVDDLKTAFDEWHFGWLDAGCTDQATPDQQECVALLSSGIGIATEGDELLAGRTVDDELAPVQTGVSYAVWRGGQWRDADCDTTISEECADLTYGLVDDLEYTHEFLQLWSR